MHSPVHGSVQGFGTVHGKYSSRSSAAGQHLRGLLGLFAGGMIRVRNNRDRRKTVQGTQEGDVLFIAKIEAEDGATVTFDKVLAVTNEGNFTFGKLLCRKHQRVGENIADAASQRRSDRLQV